MTPCWHLLECDFGISLKRFCPLSVAGGCIHPPKTSLRVPMFFVLGAILMVELLGSFGAGADWWLSLHVVAARALDFLASNHPTESSSSIGKDFPQLDYGQNLKFKMEKQIYSSIVIQNLDSISV
ncbi:hypothetical protein Pyn_05304 [Prunus yedoensis var. nudiflora]|uniref:Uncharacterized protein n=1 Tax=Prunus yedoensis var. nudiflora TaxID=2094558 RepID=A0A314YBH0_PRUYE|nr:hypothetical protein Pyn_05304 [Prunus yedoensis var. nudiflora]